MASNAFGVVPNEARVVKDGNLITRGGVTAGIDLALALVAELAGEDVAQELQFRLEYGPAPPFEAGRPEGDGRQPDRAWLLSKS